MSAVCDTCGARYRVPDPTKVYNCKACGDGKVRAVATPPSDQQSASRLESSGTTECPACGTTVDRNARFCVSCGAGLEPTHRPDTQEAAQSRAEARANERKAAIRRASSELRHTGKAIKFLGRVLLFNALPAAALMGLAILDFDPGAPTRQFVLQVFLYASMLFLCVAGYFHVKFQPLPWALGLAALWTLFLVLTVLGGTFPNPFGLLWGFALWSSVLPAMRMNRLIKEFPDLYAAQSIRRTSRTERVRGTSEASRIKRSRDALETARKKMWVRTGIAGAAIYGLSALGAYRVHASNVVPTTDTAVEDFREAWGRRDAVALTNELRESRALFFDDIVRMHGWTAWPSLDDPSRERLEPGIRLEQDYDLDFDHDVPLQVEWEFDDGEWLLRSIHLPPPPLGGAEKAFGRAWNKKSLSALAELFRGDDLERTSSSLSRMLERRGWLEEWPRAGRSHVEYDELATSATQIVELDNGHEITVRWRVREGAWCVRSIKPPKR